MKCTALEMGLSNMKRNIRSIVDNLFVEFPALKPYEDKIIKAFIVLKECYINEGKVLVCGNGGSAADCEHIVGELMKGFKLRRPVTDEYSKKIKSLYPEDGDYFCRGLQRALPAISLVSHTALFTAFVNDVEPDMIFAQQVFGYGRSGDVLIAMSTSGNSRNVVNAAKIAKTLDMKVIGFTGQNGGRLKGICDVLINVPSYETYKIQEYHLPVYHALCAMIEEEFFGSEK